MKAFTQHQGLVAPMDRANIDTDMIIPKQFLKSIQRSGFGKNLFDAMRYHDEGFPGQDCTKRPINTDFVLNQKRYQGASILLARDNFGCGSSREHAPWALEDYGFRCIIAPSFADIFYNNCFKNGLLPVILPTDKVEHLFNEVANKPGYQLSIDLQAQHIIQPDGTQWHFEVEAFRRNNLLQGLDDIGLTLEHRERIADFEQNYYQRFPWLNAQ